MYKLSHYLLKDAYYELITDYVSEWNYFIPLTLSIVGVSAPFVVDFSYSKDGYASKKMIQLFISK